MDYKVLAQNFFTNVPPGLFSLLSSPNKELYLSALFVVKEAFEDELVIGRKELREQILISLENSIAAANFEEDIDEEDVVDEQLLASLPGRATFLLSKLIKKGWLSEEDSRQGFEREIVMPDYTSDLLEVLYRQTQRKDDIEENDVFSTYAVLKLADEEEDAKRARIFSKALKSACSNSENLNKTFRNLYYYIGTYYKEHANDETVRDMLEARFREGGEQSVIDAYYYPLKTNDSIALYGSSILKLMQKVERDTDLLKKIIEIENPGIIEGNAEYEEALMEIHLRIDKICDTFRNASHKIDQITGRNADYNRRFTTAVIHNLRSDHSIVSKIVKIMKKMEQEDFADTVQKKIAATTSVFVDERSLRAKTYKPEKEELNKILIRPHHEKNGDIAKLFLEKTLNGFTMIDARKYVADKMHGRSKIETGEIIKENPDFGEDDYTLLIMSSLYGFSNGEYKVIRSGEYIEINGYVVPNLLFEKIESNNTTKE